VPARFVRRTVGRISNPSDAQAPKQGTGIVSATDAPSCTAPESVETTPVPFFAGDGPADVLIHFFPLAETGAGAARVLGLITPRTPSPDRPPPSASEELHATLAALKTDLYRRYGLESLVCVSPPMQRVLEQLRVARGCTAAVHFMGESGTGREHLARLLHYGSERRLAAFVPLDCEQLPAFDLKRSLRRLFEDAQGADRPSPALRPGTLYLKQVTALPRDAQELLVERFGIGTGAGSPTSDLRPLTSDPSPPVPGHVRLMSSSTTPLRDAVEREELLPECFYLLTALTIETPPLRQRPDDLPLLAQHLLEELNRDQERQVGGFTDEAWTLLRKYNWPGNQDELAAVVREAREACTTPLIAPRDLPFRFRAGLGAQAVGPPLTAEPRPLEPYLAQVEAEQIRWALDQARNNKSQAAALLGLTRARLYRRMEALGIRDADVPAV
jgi:DNA-binding NtrC family response regulator